MALERTVKDIQDQTAQLQEMFLNLSLGQEEVKALLTMGMVQGNSNSARSDQLGELQFDLATLRIQVMGHLVGQMALIQDLSQRQEELRVLVNQLLRNNQLGSGRQFTETDIPSSLILEHLLEVNLTALRDPIRKPNTSAPNYHPDAFCVYHSYSPGHDTDDCWALKNKCYSNGL